MTSIPLRDTCLACTDQGKGDPLVFVHGSLGSLQDFSPQVEFFSRSYRAIAYSRRYHPPNSVAPDDEMYVLSEHSADLAEIIQTLGIAPAAVIASSFGAYVSLMCAVRHPDLLSRLVLGEPPMLPLLEKTPEGHLAREEFESDVIGPSRKAFARGDDEGGVRAFFDGVAGQRITFDLLGLPIREKLLSARHALRLELMTDLTEYMPEITDEQIGSVQIPVLLLNGQRSPRIFHLITDQLEHLLPDTYRVVIPTAGHSMQTNNPDFYNGVVQEFLTCE